MYQNKKFSFLSNRNIDKKENLSIEMMPSDLKASHRKLKVQLKATKRNWELKENKWEDQKGVLTEEIEKLKSEIEAVSLEKAR